MNSIKLTMSLLILISTTSLLSCKSKINQTKNNKQHGRWITTDTLVHPYTIKAKYRKGKEVGIWKYLENEKLVRKDKHKKNKCYTEFYHLNGKIMKKGYTKFEDNVKETHWYYDGDWFFYDENGKLQSIKTYEKGGLIKTDDLGF